MQKLCCLMVVALAVTSCKPSSSATSPTSGSPTTTGGSLSLQVNDALSSSGIGGATVSGTSVPSVTTDGAGKVVATTQSGAGSFSLTVSGASIVTRQFTAKIPGGAVTLSVIPASFDLMSFNQMFRLGNNGLGLARWTAALALHIVSRALQARPSVAVASYLVLDEQISGEEIQAIGDDLKTALPLLTDGAFKSFSGVQVDQLPAGSPVPSTAGVIYVARCNGLAASQGGAAGVTTWSLSNFAVFGGLICYDDAFEAATTEHYFLRAHELGHALGYRHVTTGQTSLMNPTPTVLSDWDRQAVHIGFSRAPGSVSPDVDPQGSSQNSLAAEVYESGACTAPRK